jgi:hypothetical protein
MSVVAAPCHEDALSKSRQALAGNQKKKQFSIEEDQFLVLFVAKYGLTRWSLLASQMENRTPKQCRERWHNHLNPQINRRPWSLDEDRILASKHQQLGNKWAEIAKFLPGRTDTLVKNRWHISVKGRLSELESDYLFRTAIPWTPTSMMDFATMPPFVERS